MTATVRDSIPARDALGTRGRAVGEVAVVEVAVVESADPRDVETRAPYTIHLPGFDGPLELLLHLIEKNQLEVTTISLVTVTDQFISYLRTWDEPPLPRLAEFVAMAARLLLIKSRSLLPRQIVRDESDDESDPLEDAENLRRHLLEYKAARDIARALKARELAGLQSFARPSRLVDPEAMVVWSPPMLTGLNVNALAAVFRRVIAEKKLSEPEQLPPPLVTIAEKMLEVEAMLREQGKVTLEYALRTANSRFAVVVTFLAVLEMWHQARLDVTQEQLFGPIYIVPGPEFGKRTITSFIDAAAPASEPTASTTAHGRASMHRSRPDGGGESRSPL